MPAKKSASATKKVYFFGEGKAEGRANMKPLLGGKGANLAEMTNLRLPVPPGFTISTDVCADYYARGRRYAPGLKDEVAAHLSRLEKLMGKRLGDAKDPLLVSVRSGAAESMPGMMDTVLNLGLNDEIITGLIKKSGDPRFCYDVYRRFVQMYGDVVMGLRPEGVEIDPFEHLLEKKKHKHGVELDNELSAEALEELVGEFKAVIKKRLKRNFPEEPTIDEFAQASVGAAGGLFATLTWRGRGAEIARDILPEIASRLDFLHEVGLDYLQLGRAVTTLSGGEAQRIRLAAQLGSNLSGVLYVLDEPTIGLHPRDNRQLLGALEQLRSRGNSVVVVEHDDDTMARADHIIDLGPGAGVEGGQVVAAGSLKQILLNKQSLTGVELARQNERGQALGQARPTAPPLTRRGASLKNKTPSLIFRGLSRNNLKNLSVALPLGRFTVVTGVSGSGKSTLVRDCILPAVQADLKAKRKKTIDGIGQIKAVHEVDQSPIGRTPRSVPATYVGFFDTIRQLFAQVPEARMRGFGPARFSFNSPQGRCPDCKGAGIVKLEMNFLPPAFMTCDTCDGSRYSPEVLDIVYSGKTIAGVLELSVNEATELFGAIPKIYRALKALQDTGLGYIKLGQSSPTLSTGEAQRVKLATELAGQNVAGTVYILDEPTTGLHFSETEKLLEILNRLVDGGGTVILIEHNMELVMAADWVIDMGPGAGPEGGALVYQGPPAGLAECTESKTGASLRGGEPSLPTER